MRYLKPHRYRLWATHNHYKRRRDSVCKHVRYVVFGGHNFRDDACYCLDRIDDVAHPYVSLPIVGKPKPKPVDKAKPHILVSNQEGTLVPRALSDRAIQQFIDAFDATFDRSTGIRWMP